jgi:hypothetical protein
MPNCGVTRLRHERERSSNLTPFVFCVPSPSSLQETLAPSIACSAHQLGVLFSRCCIVPSCIGLDIINHCFDDLRKHHESNSAVIRRIPLRRNQGSSERLRKAQSVSQALGSEKSYSGSMGPRLYGWVVDHIGIHYSRKYASRGASSQGTRRKQLHRQTITDIHTKLILLEVNTPLRPGLHAILTMYSCSSVYGKDSGSSSIAP